MYGISRNLRPFKGNGLSRYCEARHDANSRTIYDNTKGAAMKKISLDFIKNTLQERGFQIEEEEIE